MKLINRSRHSEKTKDAVRIANETGAYLIVRDSYAALEISNFTNRFPVTYAEFFDSNRMKASRVRNIVIDDIDCLIEYMTRGLKIEAMTASFDIEVNDEKL